MFTSNARSCPLQTQTPEMVLSPSEPKRHTDAKACFLILSSRWYIPIKIMNIIIKKIIIIIVATCF